MEPHAHESPSDAGKKPRDTVVLRRGSGLLIDLLLGSLTFTLTSALGLRLLHAVDAVDTVSDVEANVVATAGMAGILLFRDALFGGTSPGKRIVGLRVIHPGSERAPRMSASVLRNISLLLFGVGWIVEYFAVNLDEQRRRLGDRLADTRVVDNKPRLARLPWLAIFLVGWLGAGPFADMSFPWLARTLLRAHW